MKTIRKNDVNDAVRVLQEMLKHRGFDIDVDGHFGPNTEAAVIEFQSNNTDANGHPLTPDGIVGSKTWQALMDADPIAPPGNVQIPKQDPITIRRIQTIHPQLRDELLEIYEEIRDRGVGVRFTQVLRTFAEQDNLYAQGRTTPGKIVTNARGGQSYHNYGLAVDIVLLMADGSVSWDRSLDLDRDGQRDWDEIVFVFKHHGWAWGGDWRSFKDYPHFEKAFGYTTAQLLQKHKARDFVEENYVKI